MRRFAKFTYPVLARCCSRVLLELDVLICAGRISFAAYWPATGQQNPARSTRAFESRKLLLNRCASPKLPRDFTIIPVTHYKRAPLWSRF